MTTDNLSPAPLFNRVLLTGAAGGLGRVLRPHLRPHCRHLRVSDIAALGEAAPGEELFPAALQDRAAVHAMLAGVEAVVHFGGMATEAPFEQILSANIVGLHHLYEAALAQGVRRVVFASSNHVVGFYPQDQVIDASAPPRPDTLYGVSKAFGEDLSRMYFDRYGIETVCLRIGSATPAPENHRMLATWLSHDDLAGLVLACLRATRVGHTIAFGASANAVRFWDNRLSAHLGWQPKDSSEDHRAAIEAQARPDPESPVAKYQGGVYVNLGPFDTPLP